MCVYIYMIIEINRFSKYKQMMNYKIVSKTCDLHIRDKSLFIFKNLNFLMLYSKYPYDIRHSEFEFNSKRKTNTHS